MTLGIAQYISRSLVRPWRVLLWTISGLGSLMEDFERVRLQSVQSVRALDVGCVNFEHHPAL